MNKYKKAETVQRYDSKFIEGFGKFRNNIEQSFVSRYSRGTILDGGIGTGRFALSGALKSSLIFGIDSSNPMLEEVMRKDVDRRIKLIQGDLERLPFKENVFDTIICMRVLMHLPQYRKILKNYINLLKEKGVIIFDIHNGDHMNFCKRVLSIFGLKIPKAPNRSLEDFMNFVTKKELIDISKFLDTELVVRPYDFLEAYWFSKIKPVKWFVKRTLLNKFMIRITCFFEQHIFPLFPSFASMKYLVLIRKGR